MQYEIRRNDERYGDMAKDLPSTIICLNCTEDQARLVAQRLTNWYAGCDYMFYLFPEDD